MSSFPYCAYRNIFSNFENVSVATDEGRSLKLALSEGGIRGNTES